MDKIYNHQGVETKWYAAWEKSGAFAPGKKKDGEQPFCIIMPPPNADGRLHVGHALFVTIQDILIRYHRMRGDATVWIPGADHGGIYTQVVFERKLKRLGKTRFDLGREEFYQQCYSFCMESRKEMESQLRSLGASCDWSRKRFTLDPDVSRIVTETFVRLYNDGLIYRGARMINWCPRCATVLSDLEVDHIETPSKLFILRYPLAGDTSSSILVATTRPETMLGDTAVAVHPTDKRYKHLVGKMVRLPLVNRDIPIIADRAVDPVFGTGAIKVTPAHDPNDFDIASRHKLPSIKVIGENGCMTNEAHPYTAMKTLDARKKIIEDLTAQGLVEDVFDHTHAVGTCERCATVVEPLVSKQWFVRIEPLAKKATAAVEEKAIHILPERFREQYMHWMEHVHDWCISRQLWWGHRIPVWYCDACGEDSPIVSTEPPIVCPHCKGKTLTQDPDTLDTWFSSGQWPFATLKVNQSDDFKRFYPTTVLETGYDILFFWVSRMIMLGLYITNDVPFRTVYLHGMVRDEKGRKMSKSIGNVIDPIDMADRYGADAVRMSLVFGNAAGNDVNFGETKIRGMRNFTNKLWNITRYITSFSQNPRASDKPIAFEARLNDVVHQTTDMLDHYRFSDASQLLYEVIWHEFADKLLEESKTDRERYQPVLVSSFTTLLTLLHPFMPFVTEELTSRLHP
ncbi:MAG: valine--tRNA ligase, partial [bacterium]|nr:valine--tRNA ligase [bacterium]